MDDPDKLVGRGPPWVCIVGRGPPSVCIVISRPIETALMGATGFCRPEVFRGLSYQRCKVHELPYARCLPSPIEFGCFAGESILESAYSLNGSNQCSLIRFCFVPSIDGGRTSKLADC